MANRPCGFSTVEVIASLVIVGIVFLSYSNHMTKKDTEAKLVATENADALRRTKVEADARTAAEQKAKEEIEFKRIAEQKSREAEARRLAALEEDRRVVSQRVASDTVVQSNVNRTTKTGLEDGCPAGIFNAVCRTDMRQRQAELDRLDRELVEENSRHQQKRAYLEQCIRDGKDRLVNGVCVH
jgi:hypothetical protein